MNKLSPSSYRSLFYTHVFRFLGNVATPVEIAGPHLIAVSGGVDSMVLLWLAQSLRQMGKIGPIRAAFVHHHTRRGQDHDAELVKEFCEKYKIPFEILHAQGLDAEAGNFEGKARVERRDLLCRYLKKREQLWMGHHIDDSFEWSLMQRYRSSQPKSSLGIPVRNGSIIRPFLCVTKAQLLQISRYEKIIFREDPSNSDAKYDRNFLRQKILPLLSGRYPKYLKHYVNHANYLASILNLSITNRVNGNTIHVYEQGAIIQGSQFSQYQVQDLLQTYSRSNRGEVTTQIQRMFKAIDNGKKGPFQFSGGTEIYYTHRLLMIYQQGLENYDLRIAALLSSFSKDEISSLSDFSWKDLERSWENLTRSPDAMLNMPGIVLICEPKNVCKTLNASVFDPLFPATSLVCKERGYCFTTTLKCLDLWKKKKNKLPEKLKILPLCTLSNVFHS